MRTLRPAVPVYLKRTKREGSDSSAQNSAPFPTAPGVGEAKGLFVPPPLPLPLPLSLPFPLLFCFFRWDLTLLPRWALNSCCPFLSFSLLNIWDYKYAPPCYACLSYFLNAKAVIKFSLSSGHRHSKERAPRCSKELKIKKAEATGVQADLGFSS